MAAIPSYAEAPPDVLTDAREGARASILVGAAIMRGQAAGSDFAEPLKEVGRRRARQGIPLQDVLYAYLLGTEAFWDVIWELAPEESADRAEVLSIVARSSLNLLQSAVSQVSAGYREIDEARVADEEYDFQTLVETFAGIRKPDRRHEERAALRGVQLEELCWCVVAQTEPEETGGRVRDLRRASGGAAVGRVGRSIIGFFPGSTEPKVELGPRGLARADSTKDSFRQAKAALEVAIHLKRDSVLYEEVVPLAMVLGGPVEDRQAFVRSQLGPLLDDPLGEELVRSLRAFFQSGQSIAGASRDLFVHRHTLEYRLGRVETLLGTGYRSPDRRLLLELALELAEIPK